MSELWSNNELAVGLSKNLLEGFPSWCSDSGAVARMLGIPIFSQDPGTTQFASQFDYGELVHLLIWWYVDCANCDLYAG